MDPQLKPRLPWGRIIPGLCIDVFLRRKRDFLADCRAMEARLGPRVETGGEEQIPGDGALVLVANHLQGPGLWIGWPVAVATAAIERRRGEFTHWLVSTGYERDSVDGAKRMIPLVEWSFERVAHAWSMIPVDARRPGAAARSVLGLVRKGGVCGLFPEGSVQGLTEGLQQPLEPAMKLIDRAAASGAQLLPVAFSVREGVLRCRFLAPQVNAALAWDAIAEAV